VRSNARNAHIYARYNASASRVKRKRKILAISSAHHIINVACQQWQKRINAAAAANGGIKIWRQNAR